MRVWGDSPGEDAPGLTGRRKLAELAARFSGRLTIGVAAVATTILLGLLAVAAFTLPAPCSTDPARSGQCLSPAPAVTIPQPTAVPSGSSVVVAKPLAPTTADATVTQAAQPAPGSSAKAGSLISATFDQLPAASVPAANDASTLAPAVAGAPTTRVVSTTVVHADAPAAALSTQGMQIFEQAPDPPPAAAAAPVALADPAPAAAQAPIVVADATPAAAVPAVVQVAKADPVLPASPPKRPAASAATATAGGSMVVISGGGVTVRSGPGGAQLFALARGQKVTVTGKQRGWLQVVDSQGRRGWAYSDFFGTR